MSPFDDLWQWGWAEKLAISSRARPGNGLDISTLNWIAIEIVDLPPKCWFSIVLCMFPRGYHHFLLGYHRKKNLISSHRPHPKDSSSVMLFRHVLVNLPIYCQSMWNNSWLINIIWLIMALMVISVISQSCMAIRPNVDGLMGQIMLDPRFNTKFTTFSLLPTLQLRRGKPSHRNWSYHIVPGWWF